MYLFPAEGILEVILSYGQMFSLFLVLVVMAAVIGAKSKTNKPGMLYCLAIVGLSVWLGVSFHDIMFFWYMMIPTALCFLAHYTSRRVRANNIKKGLHYNEDGLLEEELNKMQE